MKWIKASWPAPEFIKAGTTVRTGGVSQAPYDSFNLATHVGDEPSQVLQNRQQFLSELKLTTAPHWLEQTHSTEAILLPANETLVKADASYSFEKKTVCVVMTADCLPLLITDKEGSCVAAIHAGWRGLADGIVERTIAQLPAKEESLLVWLGPAIGAKVYEVGEEVYDAFTEADIEAQQAFQEVVVQGMSEKHWLFDIYHMATLKLKRLGINHIYGGDFCTFSDEQQFYSYRRDGVTGRMASFIWMD